MVESARSLSKEQHGNRSRAGRVATGAGRRIHRIAPPAVRGTGPEQRRGRGGAGIGGALRGDAYRLTVGNEVIEGTLHGDHLVIQAKTNTIGGGTGREPFDEVIRIGSNTIGGTIGDEVTLVLRSNTIGGALHGEIGDDGILFAPAPIRSAGRSTRIRT